MHAIRSHSAPGVIQNPDGSRARVQVYHATCIPCLQFKIFLNPDNRTRWINTHTHTGK